MQYIGEKDFSHNEIDRTGVLLVNLGTPDSTQVPDVRRYLAQFLSDPRIVETPRWLWNLILHGIVLRTRPKRSAAAYAEIWSEEGSPLLVESQKLTRALDSALDAALVVRLAMRYGNPSVPDVLAEMQREGVRRLLVLPMYPQYSATTVASVYDEVLQTLLRRRWVPELRTIGQYFDTPGYIELLADSIRRYWQAHGQKEKLVFSFHGIPKRYLLNGDPYHCQCHKTARLTAEVLDLKPEQYMVVFQSRFGREEWLQPYCDETLKALPGQGVKSVDVVCPAFAVDCLETLEEIAGENQELFLEAGGEAFGYIPCLNTEAGHVDFLRDLIEQHLQGWPRQKREDATERALTSERARVLGAGR